MRMGRVAAYTFALLKPDSVSNPLILKHIREAIFQSGMHITKGCRIRMTPAMAADLYAQHEGKFFYGRLIRHVCSGPVIALRLETLTPPPETNFLDHFGDFLKKSDDLLKRSVTRAFSRASEKMSGKSGSELVATEPSESAVSTRSEDEPEIPIDDRVIKRWRSVLGPSKIFANCYLPQGLYGDCDFNNIRQYFGLTDSRNVAHGSDSIEELLREMAVFKDYLIPITDPDIELFQFDVFQEDEGLPDPSEIREDEEIERIPSGNSIMGKLLG
ncbi:nucleoside diphosphate kinase domain-containing protein [Ditylenchus destructor]|uniref:Nucleoside diphosphate kinase n=1 Tax=Ditylenchus destructor TaxID=166010 RepID=A0AAD4MUN1_9BILA|nr:nucleoside diphosphate kinase domain-containing protein [Ditylenchus destructor]